MASERTVTTAELAELTGSELVGDGEVAVSRVAVLQQAEPGTITFLTNARYRRFLEQTRASAVILAPNHVPESGLDCVLLINENPHLAFARVARRLNPAKRPRAEVASTASVAHSVRLGRDVYVGPGAVIEADAEIGDRALIGPNTVVGRRACIGPETRLMANVTVYRDCRIGARVIIHSGTVIGADGFGFALDDGRWEKVPQLGRAVIGDDVELGANVCVDRGAIEDTVIEDGVKLDNFVQIAHNCRIGANTIMASMVGVSGSTTFGPGCFIGGAVGVAGHLDIVGGTVVTGMSMITHDIREPGSYSSGTPIVPTRQWRRNAVRSTQLDDLFRRLRDCERRLDADDDNKDREVQ